jgi:hypothetical protein
VKPEEIAAYVGAAAWLPQIIVWLYKAIIKPKLRVVPNQFGEVGFTNYGPIFNVRMAFFVENRDLIIDGIDLLVRHEDGESHEFRWAGLAETFAETTDASGNKQIVGKDQTPIAIKVGTDSLLEKFVRFQEPRFHVADGKTTRELVSHFGFLKQREPDAFVSQVLASKEFFSVVDQRQKWFWWKPGRYQVTLKPSSPQAFNLEGATFAFELTSIEVDSLRKNIPLVQTEISNIINSNVPDSKPEQITWQWANVAMLRK